MAIRAISLIRPAVAFGALRNANKASIPQALALANLTRPQRACQTRRLTQVSAEASDDVKMLTAIPAMNTKVRDQACTRPNSPAPTANPDPSSPLPNPSEPSSPTAASKPGHYYRNPPSHRPQHRTTPPLPQ